MSSNKGSEIVLMTNLFVQAGMCASTSHNIQQECALAKPMPDAAVLFILAMLVDCNVSNMYRQQADFPDKPEHQCQYSQGVHP